MHDKLFANQQNIKRPDLEKYAQELGLDVGKFKAALDSGAGKARIQADMALAKQVGANGTPNFFIDGRNLVGAQPFEEFKEIIDDEIARADKLIAKGTPPGQVYAAFMKGAKASPAPPPRPTSRSSRRRARAPAPRSTRSPSATRRPRAASSPRSPSSSSPSSSARSAAA